MHLRLHHGRSYIKFEYIRFCEKVKKTQFRMETELLNVVNYIKNISKKKVTFAKIAFMRKSYSLAKKILVILLIVNIVIRQNNIVIRHKGESQNGCFKKTKDAKLSEKTNISKVSGDKKCSFFRKIWRPLFPWNSRFEICPFALLPIICAESKNAKSKKNPSRGRNQFHKAKVNKYYSRSA